MIDDRGSPMRWPKSSHKLLIYLYIYRNTNAPLAINAKLHVHNIDDQFIVCVHCMQAYIVRECHSRIPQHHAHMFGLLIGRFKCAPECAPCNSISTQAAKGSRCQSVEYNTHTLKTPNICVYTIKCAQTIYERVCESVNIKLLNALRSLG